MYRNKICMLDFLILNYIACAPFPAWSWQYLSSSHTLWSNKLQKLCLLFHFGSKPITHSYSKLLSVRNSAQAEAALLCSHATFLPVIYVCGERGRAGGNCFTDRKDIDRCTEAFWNKNGAASTETTDAALWKYFFHYSSNVISHLSLRSAEGAQFKGTYSCQWHSSCLAASKKGMGF